ncbi:unnamed protein product [Allacma fusca]|uniref:Uncharacterized protein n=1 Tax=Allacma fusca TaxID=39272 RepID=A0A8J2NZA0_9HEXA|nr:unnamed protein product [Allacma fusca]
MDRYDLPTFIVCKSKTGIIASSCCTFTAGIVRTRQPYQVCISSTYFEDALNKFKLIVSVSTLKTKILLPLFCTLKS